MTTQIEIYLNSENSLIRVNGTEDNSDMLFFFTTPISRRIGYDMNIALTNLVLPLSFTLVNESNNLLIINGFEFVIPSANYSVSTLQETLQSLLTDYTVTYDSGTMKFRFQSNNNFVFNSESSCFTLLGFTAKDHYSIESVLFSDSIINLSGVNVVYFQIPNIAVNNLDSKSGSKSSIIKSIPISNSGLGSVLVWENQTGSYLPLHNDAISYLHVRIVGEDLVTPLKLNSQSWNATLTISYVKSETHESFSDIINNNVQTVNPVNDRSKKRISR